MTTAAIDLDKLNELLDNQKKLDDIFNSTFDEDFYIESSTSFNDDELESSVLNSNQDPYSNEDLLDSDEDMAFVPKKRSIVFFALPVIIEIAAICYGIMYFTGL